MNFYFAMALFDVKVIKQITFRSDDLQSYVQDWD